MTSSASSSTATPTCQIDRASRRALVEELPPVLRRANRFVLAETLANGVPVDAGELAIVLSVLDEHSDSPLEFRAEAVQELVWFGIAQFCADMGLTVPPHCGSTLFAVLALLVGSDSFVTSGDEPAALFAAVRELTPVG